MELGELMAEFAETFAVEGLVPDDDGVYRLDADDMSFCIADAEDGIRFVVWGELGDVPPDGRERLFDVLMEAMYMGQQTSGACFSVHDGVVYLHQLEALSGMNLERFKTLLERFINTYSTWRGAIADFNSVLPDLVRHVQEQTIETRSFEASGFLRV